MSNPIVHSIQTEGSLADRKSYLVLVEYPGEDARHYRFHGSSTPGHPGVVQYCHVGALATMHRVDSPTRFGDTFNEEWIYRFYGFKPLFAPDFSMARPGDMIGISSTGAPARKASQATRYMRVATAEALSETRYRVTLENGRTCTMAPHISVVLLREEVSIV